MNMPEALRKAGVKRMSVKCDYCGNPAALVGGDIIYPHRKDLYSKKFYSCTDCKAYVGCHGETDDPLGRLANSELRELKKKAHSSFDCVWRDGWPRKDAYQWLSAQMGLPMSLTHIGMFDENQCRKVIELTSDIGLFYGGVKEISGGESILDVIKRRR